MANNKTDRPSTWILVVEYPSKLDHDKMDTKIDNRSGGAKVFREGKPTPNMPSQCWGETVGGIRRLRQSYDEQWKAMEAAKRMEEIKELTLIDVYDDPTILIKEKKEVKVSKRLIMKGQLFYGNEEKGPLFKIYEHKSTTSKKVQYSARILSHYDPEEGEEREVLAKSELSLGLGSTCKWASEYREY